jgi:DNA-binding SARP family transcriptional activator
MAKGNVLKLRLLGEVELERGGSRLDLPQSKKTRALLAYLALSGREHRRERLCSLLWDVTDDPRGALRWSLSRLRPLLDEPRRERIVADRETVSLDSSDIWIDAVWARQEFERLGAGGPPEKLGEIVTFFRGEFLEGLDLAGFDEFQAWRLAEQEQLRLLHARILAALIQAHAGDPARALPHARALVQNDALSEWAHAQLVQLLVSAERFKEAEHQYETGARILKEAGIRLSGTLILPRRAPAQAPAAVPYPEPAAPRLAEAVSNAPRLVGRKTELGLLGAVLEKTAKLRREHVTLVGGEPGVGKSRLISELMAIALARGATVIEGSAYEAETLRPYGPWIDALRKVPATAVGQTIGSDLAPLLPEFGAGVNSERTRDQMYGAVVDLIAARAHSAGLVLLALDDIQWCDEASAELLHYVARSSRHRPVMIVLGARLGELPDNSPALRVLRALRRDGLVEQMEVGPLSAEDTQQLAEQVNPAMSAFRMFEETAGNPLFTIEAARSGILKQEDIPETVAALVRDRIERLPAATADALRWSAVLGETFTGAALAEMSEMEPATLLNAMEKLAGHGLIRYSSDGRGLCALSSSLVRRVAYADISEPRRRMMHGRVARKLAALGEVNDSVATDVAHHAALAGEIALAAQACVGAGRRCLRLFANTQAEAFARRGIRFAEALEEPERTRLLIDLARIRVYATRPDAGRDWANDVEQLAERALDYGCMAHARLAFHLSSILRWEGGDWSGAQQHTLRAELVSRSAGDRERMVALAEAARCLTMLERDLGHASTLLLEASQLAERIGGEIVAIPDAEGLLHQHEGRDTHAARSFVAGRELARRDRDHANEFSALEHLVMMKIDQGDYAEAAPLAEELVAIGDKLREGSEAPFAEVLRALIAYGLDPERYGPLAEALTLLRSRDAKYRLAFALTRTAQIDLRNREALRARTNAAEGLEMADKLKRSSEVAIALAILTITAEGASAKAYRERLKELRTAAFRGVSEHARRVVESLTGGAHGTRPRRTNV